MGEKDREGTFLHDFGGRPAWISGLVVAGRVATAENLAKSSAIRCDCSLSLSDLMRRVEDARRHQEDGAQKQVSLGGEKEGYFVTSPLFCFRSDEESCSARRAEPLRWFRLIGPRPLRVSFPARRLRPRYGCSTEGTANGSGFGLIVLEDGHDESGAEPNSIH